MSRILVIEDQNLLSQLYHSALATANHTVVMADNGKDGISKALREKPDLVILDLNLPGISGSEVANALEKLGILPETTLIISNSSGRRYPLDRRYIRSRCFTSRALPAEHFAGPIRRGAEFHGLEPVLDSGFSFGD